MVGLGYILYCTHVGKAEFYWLGYIHVRMTGEASYCTHVGKAVCV